MGIAYTTQQLLPGALPMNRIDRLLLVGEHAQCIKQGAYKNKMFRLLA